MGVDDEQHGFLPGGLNQKMEPWTRPIFDVFREHFNNSEIQRMIANDIIYVPLNLRQYNLKDFQVKINGVKIHLLNHVIF